MKRKTWRSKLTKKELKHLRKMEMTNKAILERIFAIQKGNRDEQSEPCFECKHIALKLNYPV